jgi:pyridoxine 5-phosphate synthase
MTKLSVNVNKIATLRNARGGNTPNVLNIALDIEKFGGQGITVHPRPDERHIRYKDVYDLKEAVTTEFNIEGYPNKKFMDLVKAVKPTQVTLVPDPPSVLTSNAGWDAVTHQSFLKEVVSELKTNNMRVSIFMDADTRQVDNVVETGTDRIELYTEAYAKNYPINKEEAIKQYVIAANCAVKNGLGLNAGHDLDLNNLKYFAQNIPSLLEVSIGHALISDALYFGLENTVQMYLQQLK